MTIDLLATNNYDLKRNIFLGRSAIGIRTAVAGPRLAHIGYPLGKSTPRYSRVYVGHAATAYIQGDLFSFRLDKYRNRLAGIHILSKTAQFGKMHDTTTTKQQQLAKMPS